MPWGCFAVAAGNNLGREKLPWAQELWDRLDSAVHEEIHRILVARRKVPVVPMADALTVPADTVIQGGGNGLLQVNEAEVRSVIEIWAEFALTKQQVEGEATLSTAVTLATRAANLLAQAEDLLINQGDPIIKDHPVFTTGRVHTRAGPGPAGLAVPGSLPDPENQIIPVPFSDADAGKYGENTFTGVSLGYSLLQGRGHYGPYTLILPTEPYADTHAPLKDTLIMPADRINPLVEGRFYGTGTLPGTQPDDEKSFGVLLSLGGNTLDLVIGRDATVAFVQEDNEGMYRFRVFERFALRDKDPSGRVLLDFARPDKPDRGAGREGEELAEVEA